MSDPSLMYARHIERWLAVVARITIAWKQVRKWKKKMFFILKTAINATNRDLVLVKMIFFNPLLTLSDRESEWVK